MPRLIAHDKRGIRHYRGNYETEEAARDKALAILAEEPLIRAVIVSDDEPFTVKEEITR
jgi:L-lysine 2,3-aminomutase